ncbi:MAG: hypothetical protein KME47_09930 [Nodosilinea sp. WJT8-NPBG4]|jgi:hypothetical protein|nr:hypothetical protein [Nodosilinea sp. WJT8-NPBG4]
MLKSKLIERLNKIDGDFEVMILDGFNGGGYLRDINLGPCLTSIDSDNVENCADCEGRLAEIVIEMGYGCY